MKIKANFSRGGGSTSRFKGGSRSFGRFCDDDDDVDLNWVLLKEGFSIMPRSVKPSVVAAAFHRSNENIFSF